MSGGQNVSAAVLRDMTMTLTSVKLISYSPSLSTIVPKTHLTNRLLMRRYSLIQQARDADVFGILVGTLGVGEHSVCDKEYYLTLNCRS